MVNVDVGAGVFGPKLAAPAGVREVLQGRGTDERYSAYLKEVILFSFLSLSPPRFIPRRSFATSLNGGVEL